MYIFQGLNIIFKILNLKKKIIKKAKTMPLIFDSVNGMKVFQRGQLKKMYRNSLSYMNL